MTWDKNTDSKIEKLHPLVRDDVDSFINLVHEKLEINLRVYEGLRTFEYQDSLYAKGRTKSGKVVTNAKGGESYHNYGLAIDVVEIKNGKAIWNNARWVEISECAKLLGFEWGGNWTFKDKPHFQKTFGYTIKQLKELHNKKLNSLYVDIG